jgi:hypothetical protein
MSRHWQIIRDTDVAAQRAAGDAERCIGHEREWRDWIRRTTGRDGTDRERPRERIIVMKTGRGPIKCEVGEAPALGDARLALLPELGWGA